MNAGLTSERVYDALRHRVLANAVRPGERLDPAILADALTSSVTPVRDALHRLVGEGLVETGVSEGFHVPHRTLPALEDLYAWSGQVLMLALRAWPRDPARAAAGDPPAQLPDDGAAAVFAAIGARSGNQEHGIAIGAINDRLQAPRLMEVHLLTGVADEVALLRQALRADDRVGLRRRIIAYHARRRRVAAEIIRLLYRGSGRE